MANLFKWLAVASVAAALFTSPARADLHSYSITILDQSRTETAIVHVYQLGKKYVIKSEAVQSSGINLAQAANKHKESPLAVSAGDFGRKSGASGLVTVQRMFLSRLALSSAMPTLLCFKRSGFQIRRIPAEIGGKGGSPLSITGDCLSAIQAPPLLIDDGRKLDTSRNPVSWRHVFVARSVSGDRVITVEGVMSTAALSEFFKGTSRRCAALTGKVTRQMARVSISPNGVVTASCNLGLTDVAILNSGQATGAVHYGIPLSGNVAASPPVALMFDD